jgi:membrane-bound lytic murein transglycosylase MltF
VPRDRLLPDLLEGRGDVAAANLTVTPERRELVDFSVPYIRDVREVVVTGPAAPAVRTLEGLAGQEVPVRPSSSYHASLTALDARLREAGLPSLRLTPVDEHLEDEDLLEMVNAGVLPFAVVDDLKARLWAQVLPDVVVRDDLVLREGGEIAFAVRKDSPRLKAALDEFVGRTGRGTTFGNVVFRRYFEGTGTLGNATAREDRERFRELAGLFRRYGERYGFEPLLLAALGYQESRLDPRARSPAGAVGVMQLLPKIARDPSVGIPDIRPAEGNIHAAAKYLRLIADGYFSDPGIDRANRVLFTLAAYNAGPTRVAGLRGRARDAGLDPNRWFDHVEVLAGERLGRETVDHVRNVLKYYVMYSRIAGKAAARRRATEEMAGEAFVRVGPGPYVYLPRRRVRPPHPSLPGPRQHGKRAGGAARPSLPRRSGGGRRSRRTGPQRRGTAPPAPGRAKRDRTPRRIVRHRWLGKHSARLVAGLHFLVALFLSTLSARAGPGTTTNAGDCSRERFCREGGGRDGGTCRAASRTGGHARVATLAASLAARRPWRRRRPRAFASRSAPGWRRATATQASRRASGRSSRGGVDGAVAARPPFPASSSTWDGTPTSGRPAGIS